MSSCYFTGVAISLAPSTQTVSEGSDAVFTVIAMGESDVPYSVVFQTLDRTANGEYCTCSITKHVHSTQFNDMIRDSGKQRGDV